MGNRAKETWNSGDAYEQYVGRWSRLVATEFLEGLDIEAGSTWGDVGCGTGVLIEGILARTDPASVLGMDRAQGFIRTARSRLKDRRVLSQPG
jgi:trans-aconitate methyltransferase